MSINVRMLLIGSLLQSEYYLVITGGIFLFYDKIKKVLKILPLYTMM